MALREAIYHRPPGGPSFVVTGAIAAAVLAILCYLAFAKSLPWTSPDYEVTAVFESSTTLRSTAPVRIAGVEVGEVTAIEGDGGVSRVTFSVDPEGRPLHSDATVTIRPRLFLEGNFFLDLRPGSPSAPEIPDGGTIPVTNTARAVQLDEILTALQGSDRENLSALLRGYGSALDDRPTRAEDRDQDPDVKGESAAEAVSDSFRWGGRAGRASAQVSQAFLGERSGDLNRMIRGNAALFAQLAAAESELGGLVTNLATTSGALAQESAALQATLRELAPTLEQAEPALAEINRTFPPLRSFARELTPAVEELPATIEAATPWLRQARPLLARAELGGIARDLRIAQPQLSRGLAGLRGFLPQLRATGECVSRVLVPAGDIVINDDFSTGAPNYQDFFYAAASQAGEGANFDGNGTYLRVQPSGGPVRVSAPNRNGGFNNDVIYGNNIEAPIGSQPAAPSKRPPVRTDVPCADNALPDLNGPRGTVGPPSPKAVGP